MLLEASTERTRNSGTIRNRSSTMKRFASLSLLLVALMAMTVRGAEVIATSIASNGGSGSSTAVAVGNARGEATAGATNGGRAIANSQATGLGNGFAISRANAIADHGLAVSNSIAD